MSQYPPQDPNYPYPGGPVRQSGPYGAPDPYGQQPPQQPPYGAPDPYGQQPPQAPYPSQTGGYGQQPAYPSYPQTPQPQYPSGPQYPGYGTPGSPSQAPYGYPVGQQPPPGYPGGPGMPPAPSSNRGTITAVAIAGVVIVLVIVGVFVVRALTGVSYQGQWYGKAQLNATSNGSNVSAQVEVFMDITQDSSANLSGSGKLCANANGTAQDIASFTLSGSASNSPATLKWSDSSGQSTGTASLSNQQMSISLSDPNGTGSLTGTLQKGSQQDYTTACASLTPVTG